MRLAAAPPGRACRHARLTVLARASSNGDRSLFIFGLGYTGLAAANYFTKRGWHVAGTCRTEEKTDALRLRGFNAHTFHTDGFEQLGRHALKELQSATHVLSTVPPDGDADPVLMAHSRDFVELADAHALQWVGYVSSTSVYGEHGAEWVDEGSDLLAAHGKGLSRILSEGAWTALCYEYGLPVHVFRCGGIYGPRRSALEAAQREAPPSASQTRRARQRYTARCHVGDICKVLDASIARPRPGGVYNVVDDEAASRGEVMEFAARLLAEQAARLVQEVPMPQDAAPALQSVMSLDDGPGTATSGSWGASFLSGSSASEGEGLRGVVAIGRSAKPPRRKESRAETRGAAAGAAPTPNGEKRVRNDRIKSELGVELEYPTYREGLMALANGDERPFE